MATVHLLRGRSKPLWAGHPWVYAASVERVEGDPPDGAAVEVRDDAGRFLGRGFWNSRSILRVRILTREEGETDLAAVVAARVREAAALRELAGVPAETDVYRVIHAEGDGLPGIVVDACAGFLVVQVSVLGMEALLGPLADALAAALRPRGIWLRGGARHARAEGISGEDRPLRGVSPPDTVWARERGVGFGVDLRSGAKTGHFSDQRENRARFAALCRGRRVLDAFCGTGGFALHALVNGGAASAVCLDGSEAALERLRVNAQRNGVGERIERVREDGFLGLRRLEGTGARFGAVSVDPPRLADNRHQVEGALKALREIHLRALLLLEEGGVLAASSCSGAVGDEPFEETLREAARLARRRVQVVYRGGQGPDHPWSVVAPEGRYLRFLLARVGR
ncbi:MAG: class I SAM-dependent methyltransferase [Planctomycetes bacterium]|nr:class I SAM-dependent methyltransferase [Planctomycetota bacterium]